MDKKLFLRIKRNGLFADGIYTKALPYPLGIQDIEALVNEKRSFYSSIKQNETMHLNHDDKKYLRQWVFDAVPGRSLVLIDAHDAAKWEIEAEVAHW